MNYDSKKVSFLIKNTLICSDIDEILDRFRSKDEYFAFLAGVECLLEHDQLFLASFSSAIDLTLNVINQKRFELKTTSQMKMYENSLIQALNQLQAYPENEALKKYIEIQKKSRLCPISTYDDLLQLLANDGYLIKYLEKDEFSIGKDAFLSSTSYLLYHFKELYEERPKHVEKTYNYLNMLDKEKTNIEKKQIKSITKRLKKI